MVIRNDPVTVKHTKWIFTDVGKVMMAFILATDFDFIAYMRKIAFFWKLFSRQWRFWNIIYIYIYTEAWCRADDSIEQQIPRPEGLMAGRWQHADQMPIKSGIDSLDSQRIMPIAGRCRVAEQMPSICRANRTLALQGADARAYSRPRSGCQQSRRRPDIDPIGILTAGRRRVTTWSQQSRRRPDSEPMGILTAGRRRVTTWMPTIWQSNPTAAWQRADDHSDIGPTFSTLARCQVCMAIDQQINNTHVPSWHLTDAVLLTLADVVPISGWFTCVSIQVMYWQLHCRFNLLQMKSWLPHHVSGLLWLWNVAHK